MQIINTRNHLPATGLPFTFLMSFYEDLAFLVRNSGKAPMTTRIPLRAQILMALVSALTLCNSALAGPGAVDGSFIPPAPNGWVLDIAVQPDGKILVAGEFTTIGGVSRSRIARLFPNGTVDPSFDPGVGPNDDVRSFAVLPNGQIVIVGDFTSVSGTPRNHYARLNTNGTHDATFATTQPTIASATSPTGPHVFALPDGKSLLVGMQVIFFTPTFISRLNMVRLNQDGSCDTSFNLTTISGSLLSGGVTPDGQYLAVGSFTTTAPTGYTNLARIDTNGTVDATFIAFSRSQILSIVRPMPDGQLIVIGTGSSNYVRRLLSTGAEAPGFNAPYVDGNVFGASVMPDNKICIGGDFSHVNMANLSIRVARLNTDGSFDSTFNVGEGGSSSVLSMAAQPDGKLLVGGAFVCFSGSCPTNLVRLDGSLSGGVIASSPAYGGGVFSLSLSTAAGKTYTLQYVTSITGTNWTSILPATAGDGTAKTLSDPGAASGQRFYRILVN